MRRWILALVAAAVPILGLAAEAPPAQRILDAALADSKAYERLAWLCDRIGHRLSGSPELEKAVAWAEATMKADGADRVWKDDVPVPVWIRGEERGRIVAPVEHPMNLLTLGMSVPTPPEGVTGEVVMAASLDELRALGDKVRGKVVFFNRPIERNGEGERGYGFASNLRFSGTVEAAKLGAVAMIIRSLGTADYHLPHTGTTAYDESQPRVPAAAITAEDAERIARLLAAGDTVKVQLVLRPRRLPDGPSHNVLAEIRGRERPDEVVVIGGHLDSWDVGCGAQDNGAGVVVTMEAIRLLKKLGLQPRRTIRAVLFTNEENGGRGGKDYATRYADSMDRHVAAIEIDSGGARPTGFGVSAGPGGIERVAGLAAPLAGIDADAVKDGGGGADTGPMRKFGVPLLGLRPDTTHYFDYHHTEADTVDKIDPHELAMLSGAMAVMAFSLADAEDTLPRIPEEARGSRR
jgi:Zn-dependent M28 family amino/carboxypeptidase